MTRKSKKQLESEATEAASDVGEEAESDVFGTVDKSAELIDPTPAKESKAKKPVKPKASEKAVPPPPGVTDEEIAAAAPKRYLVVRGGPIMHRGHGTELRTGKTIKAGGYNIEQLLQQGIELKEVTE